MIRALRERWLPRLRVRTDRAPRALRAVPAAGGGARSLEHALAAAGTDFRRWWRRRAGARALYPDLRPRALARLCAREPALCEETLQQAERVLRHEFDLLGSGPFVSADPLRAAAGEYRPLDWCVDPVAVLRFPNEFPRAQWNLERMRPAGADVKHPWEIGRCQHWVLLAQAQRIAARRRQRERASRFAREIVQQWSDFRDANPVGCGVQWVCTMDAALRAVSWCIALEAIRGAPQVPRSFWPQAYASLYEHGVFVADHLENHYEVTSNHYLSNLLGLLFVGRVFGDLPEGRAWWEFARRELEREIQVQVLADGADYESSLPYHRMVTEMLLGAAVLARGAGQPMSAAYLARLRSMVEYLAELLRPDGLMPQLGDADDGRLHRLSGYGSASPQDARHLFAPAACALEEARWLALAGPAGIWEAGWWGFEVEPQAPHAHAPAAVSRVFSDSGVAVVRRGGCYLLVSNGPVGTAGFGNHKHNDQLSFEFHLGAEPLIVDPGSGVYTSHPEERNRFRSTAYHNTLRLDGREQNELRPDWLFRLFERAHPRTLEFRSSDTEVLYRGRHEAFADGPHGVVHERSFYLLHGAEVLLVIDRLTGSGPHRVDWHFHLAPGIELRPGRGRAELEGAGSHCALLYPGALQASRTPAWYSPSYGRRIPCAALDLHAALDLGEGPEGTWTAAFAIGRVARLAEPDTRAWLQERMQAHGAAALETPEVRP